MGKGKIVEVVLGLLSDTEYKTVKSEYTEACKDKKKFDKFLAEKYEDAPPAKSIYEKFPGIDLTNPTQEQKDYWNSLETLAGSGGKRVVVDPEDRGIAYKLLDKGVKKFDAISKYVDGKFSQAGLTAEETMIAKEALRHLESTGKEFKEKKKNPSRNRTILAEVEPDHQPEIPLAYSGKAASSKDTSRFS